MKNPMNTPTAVAIVIAAAMIFYAWLFSTGRVSFNRFFAEAAVEVWIQYLIGGAILSGAVWLWKKRKNILVRIPTSVSQAKQAAVLIFGIVLAGGLVAVYYYIFFLPAQERERAAAEFRQQEKCREIGIKLHRENIESFWPEYSMFEPRYAFNKKLNTCLYGSGIKSREGRDALEAIFDEAKERESLQYWERWVKDALSNETILQISSAGLDSENEEIRERIRIRIEKYWSKHDELFSP